MNMYDPSTTIQSIALAYSSSHLAENHPISASYKKSTEKQSSDYNADFVLSCLLSHAASLLGLTALELKQYLQDGDLIIYIAHQQGIATEQFRELLCHNISLTLKEEYSSGSITQWQYEKYETMTKQQLDTFIPSSNGTGK